MKIGLIIIGSELLTGKRQDKHFAKVVEILNARGLELSWARIVGDSPDVLTQTLRESFASDAVVFSCGGIGATPDDITRLCAAAAAGVAIERHAEGEQILLKKFGERIYPHGVRMVEYPAGATLIPNPVNQVPGFSVHQHHFVPGFPAMAWPMIEWVLDQQYADQFPTEAKVEQRVLVHNVPESFLVPLMEEIIAAHPQIEFSCLPQERKDQIINELGLRGLAADVAPAYQDLVVGLEQREFAWEALVDSED